MSEQRFAEMISKMAHELRSPLTSVKGFSATLVTKWDRFTDDQRKEFIEAIHHDAERMARIVTEVLDLARAEAGRLELNRSEVLLGDVVSAAMASLTTETGIDRVTVDIPEGTKAFVDKDRIGIVVHNLLENALRFSESGPISIAGRSVDGAVRLSVADRGIGIEAERLGQVFAGPGPRGQKVTPKGTGLGLYLSRALVEAHGGKLSVESEPGSGSTFTVILPEVA